MMWGNRFYYYLMHPAKVLTRQMCKLPAAMQDPERIKFFETLFGCSWSAATKIQDNAQLFELETSRLQKSFDTCLKVGIDKNEMRQNPDILTIISATIEHHALLLVECGFKRADPHSILNYIPIQSKRISLLKAHGLIPNNVDPSENILSYLEPEVPGMPRPDHASTTLKQVNVTTRRHYLAWRLDTTVEHIDKLIKTYQRIRHRSFRLMKASLDFVEQEIGFSKEKILKHGYLIHCSQENATNTLKALPMLGGLPTIEIYRRFPKILMTSSETMVQITKHLKDFGISDEAILKCPEIFTLGSASVLHRLRQLHKVPDFKPLLDHPRVLRLVHYQTKAEGRLALLRDLQVKCASLHVLASAADTFDRYAKEGADKTKGTDISGYLEKHLGYSETDIRQQLNRHPYWCHVPLVSVHETFNFLSDEGFTKKQIFDSIHVLLYPKEKVEAELRRLPTRSELSPQRLTPLCRGWAFPSETTQSYSALAEGSSSNSSSSSESDGDQWLTGKPRASTDDHRLDFAVYFMEREHHFTGDGVWPPCSENDGTVNETPTPIAVRG